MCKWGGGGYLPKYCVLSIEKLAGIECDEELATVCVGCILIGASQESAVREAKPRVELIFEEPAIVD